MPVHENVRVRDRERTPSALDIKRVLRQIHREGGAPVGMREDVKGAHQLVPIAQCDWHLLGCRGRQGVSVFINRTGTFRIVSADYW